MSISLKVKNADEIMQQLADVLGLNDKKEVAENECMENQCAEQKADMPEDIEEECMECGDAEVQAAIDFTIVNLVKVANVLDNNGFHGIASLVDEAVQKVASKKKSKYKTWKGKGEKPPKGAAHKAPKGWWDEMEEEIQKKNPDYSKKRVTEIVGDIWDNQLSDKKREKIYEEYGKKGNPNK